MKPIEGANDTTKSLTYEELKACKGFEHISESDAQREIETINRLLKVLYLLCLKESQHSNTNEHES